MYVANPWWDAMALLVFVGAVALGFAFGARESREAYAKGFDDGVKAAKEGLVDAAPGARGETRAS